MNKCKFYLLFVLLFSTFALAHSQKRVIKGVVYGEQQLPLIQASVSIKADKIRGTVTDLNGNYSIEAKKGEILEFSYLGYTSKFVTVGDENVINVTLDPDATSLEGTVVTALGIKRSQKALSYNVQEVKSDLVTTVKDANFMNALSGKIAGVNINSSSSGIGGATRVVMRGPKSLEQTNLALYVIDGIPINNKNEGSVSGMLNYQPKGEGISDINPDDIESISVLSGPAAAALYGAQAAQGVIMITTKKGKEGKISVSLSNSTAFSSPFVMPKFQTEYVNTPKHIRSWGGASPIAKDFNPAKFFNLGYNIQNTASVTIGNRTNQTYVSIGTTNSSGIIPNSKYNRYNFTFRNTTSFLKDKMTLDFSFNYIKQNDLNLMSQGQYYNPLPALYLFPRGENFDAIRAFEIWDPNDKIFVQNWNYGDALKMQNPYWIAYRMNRSNNKDRFMINGSLKYEITDWLNVVGRLRSDMSNSLFEDKRYASTLMMFAHSPYGYYRYDNEKFTDLYADLMVNINKTIYDFNISANLGMSTNRTYEDLKGLQGGLRAPSNVFTPYNINYAEATTANHPNYLEKGHINNALFASVELSWKNMVYLTLTGREDWDSSLAYTDSNPFFYPSVGLSGIISEMVKMPSWFDFLKIRGSWAKVGSPIPAHLSTPYKYGFDPKTQSYASNTYKFPDNFYPELTYSWEGGISAKFFKNRLNFDFTVYQSNTKNQTLLLNITPAGGYNKEYVQTGNVMNRGIELSVGVNNTWGDFTWASNFTYSANKNKIVELFKEDPAREVPKDGLSGIKVILRQGGSMGDYYIDTDLKRDSEGYVALDEKGNLMMTPIRPKFVGSVLPKANLGWINDFYFKGLNMGFMISARIGGIVMSQTQALMDYYGVSERSAIARKNGGIPINNGVIDAQKFYDVTGGDNPLWSEYIYDGTNVRLQEAHIGYTLPSKWFKDKARLSLGITARNLFMIYNKAPFDPELTASTGTYYQGLDYFMQPSLRNIGFNVKLQF